MGLSGICWRPYRVMEVTKLWLNRLQHTTVPPKFYMSSLTFEIGTLDNVGKEDDTLWNWGLSLANL